MGEQEKRLEESRIHRSELNGNIVDLDSLTRIYLHAICPSTKKGSDREEISDAQNVALTADGSIVIPHLGHTVETLELLQEEEMLN